MDRFIDKISFSGYKLECNLKSNMDRFIVIEELLPFIAQLNLKSNMDRFIVFAMISLTLALYI